ncbi:MAG TPA: hypothetical protein VEB64_00705 [Azospirillaceae bacterium]|nr:hypothetical protein [Azospirillaceae bacterium]
MTTPPTPPVNDAATPPAGDIYLDVDGVVSVMADLGFGRPTKAQVIGWFDRKQIPWFKGLDGRRYISKKTLIDFFRRRQANAVKEMTTPTAPVIPTPRKRGRPPKAR